MINTTKTDVIIIGGGIVGAACAYFLAQKKLNITVLDHYKNPATYAGMGHIVRSDDHPDELNLTHHSLALWHDFLPSVSADCAWKQCGTLWLAETEEEMQIAQEKYCILQDCNVKTQLLTSQQIQQLEPMLRNNLAGGLQIPSDGILYAPNVAKWFLESSPHIQSYHATASAIEDHAVELNTGQKLYAEHIIIATGLETKTFAPFIPIIPKKGQLAITDRYTHSIQHELVELGYTTSVHTHDGTSVAFNLQARPTGQLFIGSSREFHKTDKDFNFQLLQSMLQRALQFVPDLQNVNIIRCWTGVRAATQDGLPIIDRHPLYPNIYLAIGHEGMGITAAPGTADLICRMIYNEEMPYNITPFRATRFAPLSSQRETPQYVTN